MRIITPASTLQEAELLLLSGASALIVDVKEESISHLGNAHLHRSAVGRETITSIDELRRICNCARHHAAETYACLDAESYSDKGMRRITDLVGFICRDIGIDGVITCNPGLIVAIREEKIAVDVVLSPEELVLNKQTVLFWNDLGVMKIILPSYLNVSEIAKLSTSVAGCSFYITAIRGYVPSTDTSSPAEAPSASLEDGKIVENVNDIFCALCTIPRLSRAGVSGATINLEGEPCNAKIGLVTVVKRLIEMVEKGISDEEVKSIAIEEMECGQLKESGYLCLDGRELTPETHHGKSHPS
ncbi:MAG: U32 family peptidase [Candidatus Glassbacteria bacterium]